MTLEYMTSEDEHYIPEKTSGSAAVLVNEVAALFAGGTLSEEDKDLAMRVIQEAYWDSKGIKIPADKK